MRQETARSIGRWIGHSAFAVLIALCVFLVWRLVGKHPDAITQVRQTGLPIITNSPDRAVRFFTVDHSADHRASSTKSVFIITNATTYSIQYSFVARSGYPLGFYEIPAHSAHRYACLRHTVRVGFNGSVSSPAPDRIYRIDGFEPLQDRAINENDWEDARVLLFGFNQFGNIDLWDSGAPSSPQ